MVCKYHKVIWRQDEKEVHPIAQSGFEKCGYVIPSFCVYLSIQKTLMGDPMRGEQGEKMLGIEHHLVDCVARHTRLKG